MGDPNALGGAFNGTVSYVESFVLPPPLPPLPNGNVNADVDFAVYAPGQFDLSFGAGADGGNPSHFVYAYQIHNIASSDDVILLTVGLDGDETLGSVGFLSGADVDPTSSNFSGITSAAWGFQSPTSIANGQSSDILFFTSAQAPEFDNATLSSGVNNSLQQLPSPSSLIPEPATLALFGIGVTVCCLRKRPKQNHRGDVG